MTAADKLVGGVAEGKISVAGLELGLGVPIARGSVPGTPHFGAQSEL